MTDASPPIRVLLVDDHPLIRAGTALVIEATDDLVVCGEAGTGEDAVERAAALAPDVVLMDVRMPGMGGIEATRRIAMSRPDTRMIMLTTFDLDEYAFASLHAGASAFLLKGASPERLTDAISTVARGDAVLEPRVTRRLIEAFAGSTRSAGPARASTTDPRAALPPLLSFYPVEERSLEGVGHPGLDMIPAPCR